MYRLWRWQLSPGGGRLDDDRAIGSAGLLRGGTNRLSRGLAARDDQDSGGQGITVNLAAPGLHATDRLLERGVTGRTGDPTDFGQVIAFLCSQQAGFINGAALGIDGGAVLGLL